MASSNLFSSMAFCTSLVLGKTRGTGCRRPGTRGRARLRGAAPHLPAKTVTARRRQGWLRPRGAPARPQGPPCPLAPPQPPRHSQGPTTKGEAAPAPRPPSHNNPPAPKLSPGEVTAGGPLGKASGGPSPAPTSLGQGPLCPQPQGPQTCTPTVAPAPSTRNVPVVLATPSPSPPILAPDPTLRTLQGLSQATASGMLSDLGAPRIWLPRAPCAPTPPGAQGTLGEPWGGLTPPTPRARQA